MRKFPTIATYLSLAALLTVIVTSPQADAAEPARMVTYQQQGNTYYALSLTPAVVEKQTKASSVVVLFDTSASQQGAYRTTALAALEMLLDNLRAEDRVELMAVDLGGRPLTDSLVAANSDEIREAVDQLRQQVPLGSTDLSAALRTATDRLVQADATNRTIVYIGDGISIANLLDTATLRKLVGLLRDARVSVSSLAVGPKIDAQLLAVLANQTGGNLYVQPEMVWQDESAGISDDRAQEENIRHAQIAGKHLANWTAATVLWPTRVNLPSELGQSYPAVMPPMRADRDSIVVGVTPDTLPSSVAVSIEVVGSDGVESLTWQTEPEASEEDHSYLTAVVGAAQADDGLSLPTVGSAGLAEMARLVGARMDQLTQVAQRAVATGDHQSAARIAHAILQADPGNVQARTVQHVVEEITPLDASAAPILVEDGIPIEGDVVILQGAPGANDSLLDRLPRDVVGRGGAFLDQVEQERRVFAELLAKEIENAVIDARTMMTTSPQMAMQDLKLALESVGRAADLDAGKRAELVDRLQTALKEARYQASLKDELDRQRQEELASAQARKLLIERLTRRIDREKQLMDRFSALIDERRYVDAEEVAQIVEEIDPHSVTPRVATLWARHKRNNYLMQVARTARHKATFDSWYQVELSHIPFPDVPPIIYPEADVWEELTNRRKKYASVDLSARSDTEERIQSALREQLKAPLRFDETPLNEAVDLLEQEYEIQIVFDKAALEDVAISPDTEVSVNLGNISLRSALNLMFKEPGLEDLTYVIDEEVLLITTVEKADETLKVKVYPVADLVLPVENLGIIGGGGGGQQGGGQQGGGQQGGGFGGGGGGQQGGGGGGFFNVADDIEQDATPQKANTANEPATEAPKTQSRSTATDNPAPATDWAKRFASERVEPATVRDAVRKLMNHGQHDQTIEVIQSALRHGQAQSWMYESLGIAMELAGRPKHEIERAIMSACDFSTTPPQLVLIAQYLSNIELDSRAVEVYRQVLKWAPLNHEAYALALRAAQRADDVAGIRWATLGILENAWPRHQQAIRSAALRIAKATLDELRAAGDEAAYAEYENQLNRAVVRDVVVKVSWTGDADVDLIVEEPGGTICSLHEPRTTGGGLCRGDSYTSYDTENPQQLSEEYLCAKAFPGEYRVRIRKVWGDVVAGKVAVEVYKNFGAKSQLYERQHITVRDDSDAMVLFELENGRRTESLAKQQLDVAINRQAEINHAVLAQQLGGLSDPRIAPLRGSTGNDDLARRLALAGRAGAVGFQPIIQTLPSGTQMIVTGVVSADRRYVRISASPSFTGVGNVQSFTFAGQAQTGGGGGGAQAGGGGGI